MSKTSLEVKLSKNYDSKDIVVLEGLDAVRMRPGMYIGTTGPKGLHHLLWEIVDNSIDEISNGFGNKIVVTLFQDGSAQVEDNGRGIPVDPHPQLKVSGVEVVFTQLHAGGKFGNENYGYSGGLHGVGASVTNALSRWLEVEVCRDGSKYEMKFESKTKNGKIKSGAVSVPLHKIGEAKTFGTKVRFLPDDRVFEDIVFSHDVVSNRLRELAFLNKGVEIVLIDERLKKNEKQVFKYNGGLKDFVVYLNTNKGVEHQNPVYICGKSDLIELECAFQYTNSYTENIFSYVNNIPTSEGGTHETGLKSALTRAFNDVARRVNLLKDKEENPLGEDYREGLTVALAIKMRNIQFEGQTKTKLGNPEIKGEVENIVYNQLVALFEKNENKSVLELAIKKGKAAAKVREAARKAKEITRQKNSIENSSLIGKLASASGRKPEMNELFIVEGDSAGGSAKQARDRSFQAILPLRGKPLNAEKKRLNQVLANEEIRTIISALGTGIGEDFDLSALKYYKVIILSDADQDGAHIRAILMTFFFRYMRELVTNGHLYIGLPPLYKVEKKGKIEYVYSDAELPEVLNRVGKGYSIQRYKGLGEMNPEQLWDTTMDPKARTLLQVTVEDAANAELMITTWMGDDIEARKSYISEHANFNKKDTFADKKRD
ncbi:MAG: DNA gyrase subunit B [Clostridia bacterium]|nr:DNA gyrase subunit B [Clostridia bacterium]